MRIIINCLAALFLLSSSAVWAGEAALVTALKGDVGLEDGTGGKAPLQPFIKLHAGDMLQLEDAARLQITYFQSARQEIWVGPGSLEVGTTESKAVIGRLQPQTQQLSMQFAKQLAKTPAADSRGKVTTLRTRAIATTDSIDRVKQTYQEMRAKAQHNDRNPELYLLSAYFELKEYDQVRDILNRLDSEYPGDMEIKILKSLYAKAINNAKMGAK